MKQRDFFNHTFSNTTLLKMRLTILFLFCSFISLGQAQTETYRFSEDILKAIENDSTAWKYQTGATALSFSGYYKDVLSVWDKNGIRKPSFTEEDQWLYNQSKKINAKEYIIEQAKNSEIVIINEAHHIAQHRTFTKSLLQDLYDNGYRYLGLEALSDPHLNENKIVQKESGYYTQEPEFGNLITAALSMGYTVFGYEAAEGKNNKEREIEQAENIEKFLSTMPKGKVLIHCGYAHAFENEYPAWGKAMAGRLKENLQKDPFTIDQTMYLERSAKENNPLFMQLNDTGDAIVLIEDNGNAFNGRGTTKQTDVVVVHPITQYVNNRPDWFAKGKKRYAIPSKKLKNQTDVLVLAYRKKEKTDEGIPADVIEITKNNPDTTLYLESGTYTLVIKNRNYQVIQEYDIKIK